MEYFSMKYLLSIFAVAFLSFSVVSAQAQEKLYLQVDEKVEKVNVRCMPFKYFLENYVKPGQFRPIGEWLFEWNEKKEKAKSLDILVNNMKQFMVVERRRNHDEITACILKHGVKLR